MSEPLNLLGDERPKRHGWAPGAYICRCHDCKEQFIGDKRAILCAPCAYMRPDPPAEKLSEPDLLKYFVTMYASGAQGCEMEFDTAQALAKAIDRITAERDALVMEAQVCMGLLEDVPGDGFGARVDTMVRWHLTMGRDRETLAKALTDLLDLCLTLGDFKNGVTHNCIDEGEVHASGIFDQARAALASTAPVASDRSEDERDALRTALMRAHQFINPDSDPMGLTNRELMAEIEAILTSTSRVPSDNGVSAS